MASGIMDRFAIIAYGEMTGSASAAPFTSVKGAKWVKFKAHGDNAGSVYIGKSGVTKSAGTTSATGGWEISKGQETDWLPVPGGDLANLFYIGDNVGDDVSYIVLG